MAASKPLLQEKIARRAYEIYIEEGRKTGHDLENWIRAEKEIALAETPSQSEPFASGSTRKVKQSHNPNRS